MLKEACNKTLPLPECLLPNYTVPWNDNMSLTEVNAAIYYTAVVLAGIPISIIGLITSIICSLIFSIYPLTQTTTRYLLIISSINDTIYLTILSFSRLIGIMLHLDEEILSTFNYIIGFICTFFEFFQNWTIVFIASERFMLICHPQHLKEKEDRSWLKRAFIGLMIFTLVVKAPTVLTLIYNFIGMCDSSIIFFSIDGLTDVVFFTILPLFLLTFFTVRILLKTQILHNWRKTHTTGDDEHPLAIECMNKRVHKTIMIVLISFLFLTCTFVPNGIIRIMIVLGNKECMVYLARYITAAMSYLGPLLNSSINFFIYFITWPKFRLCFWRLMVSPFICDLRRNVKDFPDEIVKPKVAKVNSIQTVETNGSASNERDR